MNDQFTLRQQIKEFLRNLLEDRQENHGEKEEELRKNCTRLIDFDPAFDFVESQLGLIRESLIQEENEANGAWIDGIDNFVNRIRENTPVAPVQHEEEEQSPPAPRPEIDEGAEVPALPREEGAQESIDGGVHLVDRSTIKIAEPFKSLYPRRPAVLNAITESMKIRDFDPAHPLPIWREKQLLLDGHTRLAAADQAGITKLYVAFHSFATEEEALEYALSCQRDRRNLTDGDILHLVRCLDELFEKGRPPNSDGKELAPDGANKSAAATADRIGTNTRKVERARRILGAENQELVERVRADEISINKAENSISEENRQRKKHSSEEPEPVVEHTTSEGASPAAGTPASDPHLETASGAAPQASQSEGPAVGHRSPARGVSAVEKTIQKLQDEGKALELALAILWKDQRKQSPDQTTLAVHTGMLARRLRSYVRERRDWVKDIESKKSSGRSTA